MPCSQSCEKLYIDVDPIKEGILQGDSAQDITLQDKQGFDTMSDKDNIAISHVLLCCVAGRGLCTLVRPTRCSYSHIGMHLCFFVHGLLGFLKLQNNHSNLNSAYAVSLKATRCLAVPCLVADVVRDTNLAGLHALTGVVPFVLAVNNGSGDYQKLINYCLIANIVCLAYYSLDRNSEWSWYASGAAVIAYFVTKQDDNVKYPLALALLEYCARSMNLC